MSQSSNLLMLGSSSSSVPSSEVFTSLKNEFARKKKRRPAGTPDPNAEVVSLSPETLMGTDYYVCEICKQGFQREQNLQMHRRRHNVPWKLLKRDVPDSRKRVYVCPEPTCLHHQPCHALGDLVGIKKHFRRKHSNRKQWVCEKCSKGYAVQSDYKAHLKTCGTRGHFCDCGRVFSRVEAFIEHQDKCKEAPKPAYLLKASISPELAINAGIRTAPPAKSELMLPNWGCELQFSSSSSFNRNKLTSSMPMNPIPSTSMGLSVHSFWETEQATQLKLSLGSASHVQRIESNSCRAHSLERINGADEEPLAAAQRLKEEAREQLQMAMEETAFAEDKRRQANWQIELAKLELTNARKIREQAMVELNKAQALKECAMKQINPTMLQITCNACRRQYYQSIRKEAACGQQSPFVSYMSWVGHYGS